MSRSPIKSRRQIIRPATTLFPYPTASALTASEVLFPVFRQLLLKFCCHIHGDQWERFRFQNRQLSHSCILTPLPQFESIVSSTCVTGRAGQPFTFQVLTNNASSDARLAATGLPYQSNDHRPGDRPHLWNGASDVGWLVPNLWRGNKAHGWGCRAILFGTHVCLRSVISVITSSSNATLIPNKFFSYTITADASTTSLDYLGLDGMLNGLLPAGLSYDPATATISGVFTGDDPPDVLRRSAPANQYTEGRNGIETIKKEPPPKILLFAQEEENGTGIAPLNFIISLHDFEAEALSAKTSEKTDYVIFTDDPLTSGGAAGLLRSTKVGDYIDYTIPVNRSGTYDVKLGIRTDNNQGIFQLAIDGVNHGSPQDGYPPWWTTRFWTSDRLHFPKPGPRPSGSP